LRRKCWEEYLRGSNGVSGWAGHVAFMEKMREIHTKFQSENLEGIGNLGDIGIDRQ
jgi:hypothetical protein